MTKLNGLCVGMLAGGAVVLAGACQNRDTGAVTSKASEAVEHRDMALVRVVNAVPGGKPVSIWAGDSAAFGSVAYGRTTSYREIPDDMFTFQIKSDTGTEPLAQNRENLHDGGHYTIVALPDEGGAEKRNLRVLDDDLKPVSPKKARVRFINGVPGDTDVDLYLHGREDALFDGVNFKKEAGWNEFDPAAGTLEVRPDNKKTPIASLPEAKLEGGKSYTFVLSGTPGKYRIIKIEDGVAKS